MDAPVTGLVARIEHQQSHCRFVREVKPETVLVDLLHARRFAKDKGTAESWFPRDTTVVTTSTIHDEHLARMPWEREFDIIESFQPDYHIPTDYPIYPEMSPGQKGENLEQMCRGTIWMEQQLAAHGIETGLFPLIKGYSDAERKMCYAVVDELDAEMAAFYGAQYLSTGNQQQTMQEDIAPIADRCPELPLLLIGATAPEVVSQLPHTVQAAAGQYQWRNRVAPRSNMPHGMQLEWDGLTNDVTTAISTDNIPSTSDQVVSEKVK